MSNTEHDSGKDRIQAIIRKEIEEGREAKVRQHIDTVTENLYHSHAAGDVGRGDVRRWIEEELNR